MIINLTDSLTNRHQHPEASAQMIDTLRFAVGNCSHTGVSRRRSFGISYNIYHTYKVTNPAAKTLSGFESTVHVSEEGFGE